MKIRRIAILGPGLLGGSIARGAASRGLASEIALWGRREEVIRTIASSDWGAAPNHEASTDLEKTVAGASIIVLGTPVGVMRDLASRVAAAPETKGALVVDVGSVKSIVDREVGPLIEGGGMSFVPCHPMAGSEKAGWEYADPDLFEGAACILTPGPDSDESATELAASFWKSLGCRIHRSTPEEHDRVIAGISHLPHAAAAALANVCLTADEADLAAALAGNGLGDTTRIAGGPPDMWTEILLENREPVIDSIGRFRDRLGEVLDFLERKDEEGLRRFLDEGKSRRDRFEARRRTPGADQ